MHSYRIAWVVIASKAKRSRLGDCGGGFVWIASLSLAITVGTAPIQRQLARSCRKKKRPAPVSRARADGLDPGRAFPAEAKDCEPYSGFRLSADDLPVRRSATTS